MAMGANIMKDLKAKRGQTKLTGVLRTNGQLDPKITMIITLFDVIACFFFFMLMIIP